MPQYYCEYCDILLMRSSSCVRKNHNIGRRHKENVKAYYQKLVEDEYQRYIDAQSAAYLKAKQKLQKQNAPNPPAPVLPNFHGAHPQGYSFGLPSIFPLMPSHSTAMLMPGIPFPTFPVPQVITPVGPISEYTVAPPLDR